ncbi:MAG: VWA domain-containing protein [Planctomycetes bacterium]|nr:VWA domain-containing protein [Planctomycetota bacterium]
MFPPPRRDAGQRRPAHRAIPLVVFLVAFLGGCLWLDATNRVVFTSPWAFALTLAAPWVWWLHMAGYSGLRGVRALVALAVRFVVLGVFIMALADPRAVRTSNVLSVLYALDVSDSMGDTASKKAMEFILRTAGEEKPEKDEAGLLVFARQAMVELPPRVTFPFEAINSRVARDGTNIEKALSLASAMLPDTKQGRIVLVTDGAATEGDLTRVLDDLAARQVPVDVLPVEYDHDREVWLEKLEVPRTVRLGETYEAAVILSSLKAGSGTLVLTENGQKIAEEKVSFEAGKNRYALKLSLREPGLYEYVATIEVPPGEDGWQKNNLAVNHIYLKGKGKVLIVAAPDEQRDVVPMVRALRRGQREVEVISGEAFPRDVLALLPYDGIVFVNVPADAFDVVQLKALHDAVYHQGTGFLMVGGKDSFGPGGYHRTPVEEALPVTMEPSQKKVLPKGALVIILHTCEFPEGNTWAKRITKEAIRVLSAKDDVGVLLYGMGEQWLFQLTPAGEYERLVLLINKAEPGDMPTFQGTMKMGFDGLKANDASQKHMIIISDGDPSPPTPALLADFQKSQISVSTIAVFPHEGLASTDLLRRIATATGGRFYHPQDPNLLPSIFIKEAKTLKRSMIDNKTFVPLVDFPSPILKGISSFPPLRGLVLTSAKPRANLVLRVPEEEDIDPVLAVWRYGVGKTAAFTSDLTTNWGADWVNAPLYEPFVNQLLTDIVRPAQQGRLRLHTYAEGSTGVIVVEDFHPEASFLEVAAQVGGPQDKSATVPLRQVGPRRYQGDFPLWGNGQYHIMVSGVGTGRNERELGRFVVPYSPEYLRFRSNPIAIEQIVKRTGGRLLTSAEKGKDIFLKQKKPRASSESVVDWFLLALACLIPLDVAVRRVQLDWLVIRSWLGLGRRRAASGATMGALLKRKEAIKFPVHERERPLVPPPVPSERRAAQPPPAVAPKPRPAPKPEPPKPAGPPPTSTTGRLLEAKKKWKKE